MTLEPVGDYVMISCSVPPGTVIPPAAQWTAGTPAMLRDAMLAAIEGWHPAARALVADVDLGSIFVIPFGFLEPAPPWEPSRVTLVGDAAHAMLPTLGLGANLALRDAASLLDQLDAASRGETGLVPAIGTYEQGMRDYVYPFMRMTMDHDRQFGGGALEGRASSRDARTAPHRVLGRRPGQRLKQWERELDVGPFDIIEHVPFDEFTLFDGGQPVRGVVFDHSAAFAAWGPVVVELGQVHAADERLLAAYRVAPGAISHVSWVVPDLGEESARLSRLGCRLINTARTGPIQVAWHDGGPLFPHPIELHQHNDVIAGMHARLTALRAAGDR